MRRFVQWAAPLVLALTLAACGGGASPASSSPTAASSSAAAKAASTAASGAGTTAPASAGAIPSIPTGQRVKIVTATGVPSVVFTSVWIAIDNGLFAKYGLDAELQNIEGVKQAQAMIAGEVPIGNIGGTEVLNSRVGSSGLIAIMQTTGSPLFELHAPPSIKTVEDVKGKTIAVTLTGSSTDIAARILLKKHGLEPDKDVKLLNASNMPGILAAMVSKQVDGGVVSPPTTVKATQSGFPKVASAVDEHVPLQNNFVVTTRAYADAHPEVVYSYLKAVLEGNKIYLQQPDVAVKSIAKHTDSDEATSKEAYDALKPALDQIGFIDEAGLKSVQEFGPNPQTQNLKLSDAYDNRFLEQLKASGFTDQLGLKQ